MASGSASVEPAAGNAGASFDHDPSRRAYYAYEAYIRKVWPEEHPLPVEKWEALDYRERCAWDAVVDAVRMVEPVADDAGNTGGAK